MREAARVPGRPKTVQAKHIPDGPILEMLARNQGQWCHLYWEPARNVLYAMPEDIPFKVAEAKMASLIRRGLATGCASPGLGYRGDFEITAKGLALLESMKAENRGGPIVNEDWLPEYDTLHDFTEWAWPIRGGKDYIAALRKSLLILHLRGTNDIYRLLPTYLLESLLARRAGEIRLERP